MARITLNPALSTARGATGDVVYKTYKRGKRTVVVMSRRADMSAVIWSGKQGDNRERMKRAGEFYRAVKADPALCAIYQAEADKRGVTLPAVTARDFFRAPKLNSFELEGYSGQVGGTLSIWVNDRIEAYEAVFSVRTPGGQVRETGKGQLWPNVDTKFFYTTTTAVARNETVVLEVVVTDRAGNSTVASVKWTNGPATPKPLAPVATPIPLRYGAEDFRAG